jgi:hypothetical protein
MAECRLDLTESIVQAIQKLSGGNAGSMRALLHLKQISPQVDPFGGPNGEMTLMLFDSFGIWDDKIDKHWAYVCGRDTTKMIAVMVACQQGGLGGASREAIHKAIDGQTKLDFGAIMREVQAAVPGFKDTPHVL